MVCVTCAQLFGVRVDRGHEAFVYVEEDVGEERHREHERGGQQRQRPLVVVGIVPPAPPPNSVGSLVVDYCLLVVNKNRFCFRICVSFNYLKC